MLLAVLPKLGGGGALAGYVAILLGTVGFAVTQTVNRMLRHEHGLARILFWPSIAGVILYMPFAVRDWVRPRRWSSCSWCWAASSRAGRCCAAVAFRTADAARLGPWNYAALPIAVVLDLLIWGAAPAPLTIAGGAVVVVACVLSERARLRALTGSPAGSGAARPARAAGE